MGKSVSKSARRVVRPADRSLERLRIGPWFLDVRSGQLSDGQASHQLELRMAQVLLLLAENAGEIVTRDTFFDKVWEGRTVTDDALTRCIKNLRQALGDTKRPHRFIETFPKRGYCLICDVEELESVAPPELEAAPAQFTTRWARRTGIALTLVLTVAIGLQIDGILQNRESGATLETIGSIAVLPLRNVSGDVEQDYLADGLTEALIAELGRIETLKVISATSARHYRDSDKLLPQIAGELGVDALIEGSVLLADSELRIILRLIHGTTDQQLWTRTLLSKMGDILALHSEVAEAIADAMDITLAPVLQEQLIVAAGMVADRGPDPAAYEAYLKGRYHFNRFGSEPHKTAIGFYEQAISIDPDFALPYAAAAEACMYAPVQMSGFRTLDDCEVAALKAVERGEYFAEAHAALGFVRMSKWDWAGSQTALLRALELNPNSVPARTTYALLLRITMRFEQSLAEVRRAEELDPFNLFVRTMVGWPLYDARRFEEAHAQWNTVLDMDPDYGLAIWNKGFVYRTMGLPQQVMEMSRRLEGSNFGRGQESRWLSAAGRILTGETEHVEEDIASLERDYGEAVLVLSAELHLLLQNEERAFGNLEKAYELRSPSLFSTSEPQWDPWRDHPRFMAIRRQMGLP